jgi:hypothetical protein
MTPWNSSSSGMLDAIALEPFDEFRLGQRACVGFADDH